MVGKGSECKDLEVEGRIPLVTGARTNVVYRPVRHIDEVVIAVVEKAYKE